MRVPGWRALGLAWAVVAVVVGGGAAILARLGPPVPAEPVVAAAPPGADASHATGPAATGEGTTPPASAAAPAATPTGVTPPAAMPPTPGGAPPDSPPATPTPARAPAAATSPPAAANLPAPAAPATTAAAPAPPPSATPPPAPEPPPLAPVAAAPRAAPRPITPPDPALQEAGRHGTVPRIGADGRTSIRTYGRDFDRRDTRPRIGIVVADIGLSASATDDAIRRLPPGVALALSPYAQRPAQAAERARERGMETLIAIPLEPTGYPLNDPGDRALLTGRGMAENLDQLDWSLARFQGYVGAIGVVAGMRGERFAALPEAMAAVQEALFRRGLLYVDPRPGAPSPSRAWGRGVDVVLDEPARTRHEIDRRLAELEQLARERGSALGLAGAPTPVLVEGIAAWAVGLDQRGVVLAPVSALIRRPEATGTETPAVRPASAP
ncbi:divergent polysaccharide deacetylase family protein [Roseomonas fluvialis]|uniref:Divergent polysaccharide deacetylase family protein n=1 Tax=Roseomonas fluvialis TaxID=1750527 RepID=A0ABM8I756_9PROT|nr:divergent polysaccharide deacetylase family protein [Roseomonas fluvialis]BDG74127.1 hypothetical protein Rmf_40560 [Roseomonas fluvialis]